MAEQPVNRAVLAGPRGSRSWGVALVICLSLPIALYGLAFSFLPDANPEFRTRLFSLPWYAYAHFIGSGLALLVGGFQFSARLRRRHPALHRWSGRTYLLACLAGGLGGLGLSSISFGGPATHVGFALLAVLWLYSGLQAWLAIRRRDLAGHQRWMIRSFALTFAAVTLRMELGLLTGVAGLDFADAYVTVAWLSWVPNLIIAEWFLVTRPAAAPGEATAQR